MSSPASCANAAVHEVIIGRRVAHWAPQLRAVACDARLGRQPEDLRACFGELPGEMPASGSIVGVRRFLSVVDQLRDHSVLVIVLGLRVAVRVVSADACLLIDEPTGPPPFGLPRWLGLAWLAARSHLRRARRVGLGCCAVLARIGRARLALRERHHTA